MLNLFAAHIRAVGASEVLTMDCMAAAGCSRAGCGSRAPLWPYQGLIRLLILSIVLPLGVHPLLPDRSTAWVGQSGRLPQPMSDQTQDFTSPVSSDANGIGTLFPASTTARHAVLAPAGRATAPNIPESLSTALAFNIFVIGDLIQHQSITYGRIAVGGNATLERYRIGDTLPRSRDNRADLIVGSTLIFTDGMVAKGGIIAGGKARLSNVGMPHGQLREGLPIDFGAQGAALAGLAASLSQLPPNGMTQSRERPNTRKQITLTGTDRQLNIFALAGRDLAVAQTLIISVPRGATVLVNIDGAADQIQNLGFAIGSVNRQHILYNFYEATELTLDDDRIQGSILAPHARVTFVKGRMNGTLIAAALTGTGVAWPAPFIGQLPAAQGSRQHDTLTFIVGSFSPRRAKKNPPKANIRVLA
jgi:choice-of-anchor A domain-containing protein